jgi:signal transduction histidine kinase
LGDRIPQCRENIRRLSRGLYPPLLESQGLAAALTAHSRRMPLAVEVRCGAERFSREVETAICFEAWPREIAS